MATTIIKNNSTSNIPWSLYFDHGVYQIESKIPRIPLLGEKYCMINIVDSIEGDDGDSIMTKVRCSGVATVREEEDMPADNPYIGQRRIIMKEK